eukprot:518715-Amphidinium_carterae.1
MISLVSLCSLVADLDTCFLPKARTCGRASSACTGSGGGGGGGSDEDDDDGGDDADEGIKPFDCSANAYPVQVTCVCACAFMTASCTREELKVKLISDPESPVLVSFLPSHAIRASLVDSDSSLILFVER